MLLPLAALAVISLAILILLVTKGVGTSGDETASGGAMRAEPLHAELEGRPAPPLALNDGSTGRKLTDKQLAGKPYLVTFLYTRCPDVCILIGHEIRDALKLMGPEASEVAAVAVSVDPSGDSDAAIRDWIDRHDLPANFHYLNGSRKELLPVWRDWFVIPQDQDRIRISLHTATVWLVDRAGRLRAKYSGGVPIDPEDLAHDLGVLVREPGFVREESEGG